jgi:hypothetical protein
MQRAIMRRGRRRRRMMKTMGAACHDDMHESLPSNLGGVG